MTTSIYVDSRFRESGTDSDFHIQLRESITLQDARLRVDKVRFIDSFFTTDSGEWLYLKNGDTFLYVGIPQQAYTGGRLATMNQSQTGKTASYTELTNSLTVAYDPDTKILSDEEISNMSGDFPAGATAERPHSLNQCLGPCILENGNQVYPFITMQPYADVYLRSRRLTCSNVHGPNHTHDIICKIPLSEGVGKTVVSGSPENVYYDLGSITLRGIDFQLTDEAGNVVNLRGRSLSFQIILDQ